MAAHDAVLRQQVHLGDADGADPGLGVLGADGAVDPAAVVARLFVAGAYGLGADHAAPSVVDVGAVAAQLLDAVLEMLGVVGAVLALDGAVFRGLAHPVDALDGPGVGAGGSAEERGGNDQ